MSIISQSGPGGILPLAKSNFMVDHASIWVGWGFEWSLPGQGEAYHDCGRFWSKGCLEVEDHHGVIFDRVDGELRLTVVEGKIFVKRVRRSCGRAECPVCYEKWAGKEAHSIERRIQAWKGRGRPIHVVVSPSNGDVASNSVSELRRKAYDVLKEVGVFGGCLIFHPFRQRDDRSWYFSPHFHILGYGWVRDVEDQYGRGGWVVKNLGVRKTVLGTAQYQLSHAGIHPDHHTVTWFGALSYSRLYVPQEWNEEYSEKCPACGGDLRPLRYVGDDRLPEKECELWLKPDDWIYKMPDRGMSCDDKDLQRAKIMNIEEILITDG